MKIVFNLTNEPRVGGTLRTWRGDEKWRLQCFINKLHPGTRVQFKGTAHALDAFGFVEIDGIWWFEHNGMRHAAVETERVR